MIKEKIIHTFFKRKRDEVVNKNDNSTSGPIEDFPPPRVLVGQLEGQNQGIEPQPMIFRGIEFLEWDPELHPQIWKYLVNQKLGLI